MKKLTFLALFISLFIAGVAHATPPIEGDVLESNNFTFGVDVSVMALNRVEDTAVPFAYRNSINPQYIPLPSYQKDNPKTSQVFFNADINARYGILDRLEISANANGYYQHNAAKSDDNVAGSFAFNSANIGLMGKIYQSETYKFIIGDNSDIISNSLFENTNTHMNFFKGHTLFFNIVKEKKKDDKFVSAITQIYYRLNLTQNYKDMSFRNGDEVGVRLLLQMNNGNHMSFLGLGYSQKDSDTLNHIRLHKNGFESYSVGIEGGGKYDFNEHFGFKYGIEIMTQAFNSNVIAYNGTIGIYFK